MKTKQLAEMIKELRKKKKQSNEESKKTEINLEPENNSPIAGY